MSGDQFKDQNFPQVGDTVKVSMAGPGLVTGTVTGYGEKDGKRHICFEHDFITSSGETVKSDRWAWPEQIYTAPLEQAIEALSFADAQDLLDTFCGVGCNDELDAQQLRVLVREAYFKGDIPAGELKSRPTPSSASRPLKPQEIANGMRLSYKELAQLINQIPEDRQNDDVTVFVTGVGETYAVTNFTSDTSDEDLEQVLDEGHFVLTI